MISNRVSMLAIPLSLGFGLSLAFAAMPRQKVGRPQTSQQISQLGARPNQPPQWIFEDSHAPTREQLAKEAILEFQYKPYEGTSIMPNMKATEDDQKFQRTIAAIINKADPTPLARIAHFAWLKQHPELRHNGWRGHIRSVVPTSGGWTVRISVSPSLDHMEAKRRIVTNDLFFEVYFFDGQNIRYVDGESSPSVVRAFFMD